MAGVRWTSGSARGGGFVEHPGKPQRDAGPLRSSSPGGTGAPVPVTRRCAGVRPPGMGARQRRRRTALRRRRGWPGDGLGRAMASGPGAQTPVGVGATETRAVRRDSPALRRYSWTLLAAGIASGVAAAVAGAPLPPVLPTLLLVSLMAVATNRIALFPSEWSATAEATVLVAAIVAFAGDAALLGPWIVALACGPLDIVHWREHVFSRMAYNSGNRMLSTLAAALAFAAAHGTRFDPPALRFALAALAASVVFAASELIGFVGVEWFRNRTPTRLAVRDDLFFDSLTVPLGMLGALAGWLAAPVGWWATALVVVPALAVPELVLVRARRAWPALGSARFVGGVRCAAAAAGVLALVAVVAPYPDTVTFGCLLCGRGPPRARAARDPPCTGGAAGRGRARRRVVGASSEHAGCGDCRRRRRHRDRVDARGRRGLVGASGGGAGGHGRHRGVRDLTHARRCGGRGDRLRADGVDETHAPALDRTARLQRGRVRGRVARARQRRIPRLRRRAARAGHLVRDVGCAAVGQPCPRTVRCATRPAGVG